ncbi:chemotaxis protein CheW [Wenzhouxiangella sp. XN24]|uniref:chemotaxis protein CheW n=1 Tax=Wenzhouxiangella sp. XN24 TaxID=2713569 RepID=UPI0013EA0DB8|nr:chemotaxis protein CheW [Wenzhouxiangella sp. XN24]NGX16056.1 chemotaxis protein CheW [Wenzhouxiangella sp. XN24]
MAEEQELLHCLLVPLVGRRLIVPRACVAEVIGLGRFRLREQEPEWLLGDVAWTDRVVPLVSFEAACGDAVPDIGGRSRALILRSLTGKLGRGGLALLCQGLPQLVRVSEEVLRLEEDAEQDEDSPVLCRVTVMNETPLVPDLEKLETRVADILEHEAG